MRVLLRFSAVLAAMMAIGCTSVQSDEGRLVPMAPQEGPIWPRTGAVKPLPVLKVLPGQTVRLSLRDAASTPISEVGDWEFVGEPFGVSLEADGEDALLIIAESGADGNGIARGKVTTAQGSETLSFAVLAEAKTAHTFTYTPPADKAVTSVFAAGEFNGWNNGKDRLTAGPDGVFTLEMQLDPGRYTYKYVVDGDWIADPGNPKQDDSGYGNSLLEIGGEASGSFDFHTLAADMPSGGDQGAFVANLADGATLTDARLVVNNKLLPPDNYTIDSKGRILLHIRDWRWGAENFVTVLAHDDKGHTGTHIAQMSYRNAPRSPRDEILYFTMTDRFFDGDSLINSPAEDSELHELANYQGGDWAGVTSKIQEGYFRELGATTVWLSPVNENTPKVERDAIPPNRVFTSYHGYWPTSLTATNPQFGSMQDLQALVASAHENGMAVLFDFVVNHVHEDHPLIQEHPDWAVDLKTPDGRDNIRLFDEFPFTTWFDTFLPTLNFDGNDELNELMAENGVWWLKQTGADGFRLDAVKHVPASFWRQLLKKMYEDVVLTENRRLYSVGETISGRGTINEFIAPDLLDGQFDFPLLWAILPAFAEAEGPLAGVLDSLMDSQNDYPPYAVMSPLIGNHDVIRFMGYADGDIPEGMSEKEVGFKQPPSVDDPESYAKIRLAFAFIMSIPGAPMIYYGDEIGLTGAHDPDNRRFMDWQWDDMQRATFDAVSELCHARQESVALRRGIVEPLFSSEERIGFARISPDEVVIVMISRKPTDQALVMTLPERWGTPKRLVPISVNGMTADLSGRRVEVSDSPWSWGIWQVAW